jgi:simple sugar transport system permease protein
MRPGRATMLAMALSGGLVGMGSALFGLGPAGGFSGPPTYAMGYVALALTLVAGSRPAGVVVVALFYGALTNGAKTMVIVTGIPLALLVVIVVFAMLFVAAPGLIRSMWRLKAPEATPLPPVPS